MALNELSEKLDQLSAEEMGIAYDESAVWSRLEQRLDNRKVYIYWWTVAACILLGLLFLPISVLRENTNSTSNIAESVEVVEPQIAEEVPVAVKVEPKVSESQPVWETFRTPHKKGILPVQLATINQTSLALQPIEFEFNKVKKPAFADEDISMIQASLERPKIEKEQSITVRAQLNTSTQPIQFNNQVLKIKLFERSND